MMGLIGSICNKNILWGLEFSQRRQSVCLSICPSGRPAPTEADDQICLSVFVSYVQTNKQTTWLMNFVEQSPSWETSSPSISQNIFRILWNPSFKTAQRLSLFSATWIQPTPYRPVSLKICFNIIVYNSNKMHKSQSLFNLTTALHVSGVTITHLQEHKTTVTTASGNRYTVIDRVKFTDKEYR